MLAMVPETVAGCKELHNYFVGQGYMLEGKIHMKHSG